MITKWTNIKAVLFELERFVPKDLYSEARLLEDCMRAVDKIGAVPAYELARPAFLKVVNHKFCLPTDCLQLLQIAYKANFTLTEDELRDIRELLGIEDQPYIQNSSLPYEVWFDSQFMRQGWTPLRLSTNSFALSVHCDKSRNLVSSCEHSYTVSPDGTVTTSFKDGFVLVSYYAYARDCDGVPMIPDDEDYKSALFNFCMMNLWEYRWNLKEEGAAERYLKYQQLWGLFKAKATASIRMPDVNQAENMNAMLLRLIPKERRFDSFFRNVGIPENLDFTGFSSHYVYR